MRANFWTKTLMIWLVQVFGTLLVLMFLSGCGPSNTVKTRSQVEVLIRKWDKTENVPWTDKTGGTGEVDAWNNPITWELTTTSTYRTLTVRSNGSDGLPYTTDDIYKTDRVYCGPPSVPLEKRVENLSEAVSRGFSRGTVGGAREGLKEGKKDKD